MKPNQKELTRMVKSPIVKTKNRIKKREESKKMSETLKMWLKMVKQGEGDVGGGAITDRRMDHHDLIGTGVASV